MGDLDFQPRRPGLVSLVVFLAGLLLAADAWLEESVLGERLAEIESRLAQTQRRSDRLEADRRGSQPENALAPEEAASIRQALVAIGVDWEALFAAIDTASGEDVVLTALRPSVSGQTVQISGEAKDMAAALAFVEALRRAPLAQAVLVSHQVKQNDPQHPIVFEIGAAWRSKF